MGVANSTVSPGLRDLALFLNDERGKQKWSTVDVIDIEDFLNLQPNDRPRRLTVLRRFVRLARTRHLVLIDPTRGVERKQFKGFRGRTLSIDQQRLLFRRWTTDPTVHPHEGLVGILALLHGASGRELRLLRCNTIDSQGCAIRLEGRPHPVPLDPASWAVLTRCLAHRQSQHTRNPHVIVTKVTKIGREPASTAYLSHVLDACGHAPRTVRSTRLVARVCPDLQGGSTGFCRSVRLSRSRRRSGCGWCVRSTNSTPRVTSATIHRRGSRR